jgi:protein SCO1/2
MRLITRSLLIALGGLALLLGAATFIWAWRAEPPAQAEAASNAAVPIGGPFELVDASGKTVTDETFRGKLMVVFFGYTHCPDLCPTTLNKIAGGLQKIGPLADRVAVLFITVDPKRDTPAVMRDYVKAFDPRIIGLTGNSQQVAAAAKAYRVYYDDAGPNDELLDHSAFIYFMGPNGKFAAFLSPDKTPDDIAAKIRGLLGKA